FVGVGVMRLGVGGRVLLIVVFVVLSGASVVVMVVVLVFAVVVSALTTFIFSEGFNRAVSAQNLCGFRLAVVSMFAHGRGILLSDIAEFLTGSL
ncbi:MAG: hypothetical protein LUE23_00720, partial [Lachnospiraceae bacterium]|nr:hypothetical protein [Lachnospiraceae bacterium]